MSNIETTNGIFDINNSWKNSKETCECEQRINPRSHQIIIEFYFQLQEKTGYI